MLVQPYSELAHPRIYLKRERKGAAAAARYSPPGTSTFNAWLKFGYIVTDGLETPSVLMSITAVKDMIWLTVFLYLTMVKIKKTTR